MIERCSCNAMIVTFSARRALDWRQSHIHEMPVEPDQPLIHESVGTHERAEPFWPEEVRQPIGFSANH